MKYKFFEHTADVKFQAYGKDLEEAFTNAALATIEVMTDLSKVKPIETKEIHIETTKKESLLYDFLSELLFFLDTEGFILAEVQELKIKKSEKGFKLDAIIKGDNGDNYDVSTVIKAVTYSDMFIKEEQDKVTIQVVHDI